MTVVVTNDHTDWFDFDTSGTPIFDGSVWGSGDGVSTLFFIEGTGSLNAQNKGTGRGGMGHGRSNTDLSATGLHIHGWVNSLDKPNTEANGGWALRLGSSQTWDTSYESWNCGGSDTSRLRIDGFIPFVADPNATADRSAGTLTLTQCQSMWVESDVTTNSGQKTVFCDHMFYGTHSRFRGGTTAGAAGDSPTAAGETPAVPVFIDSGGVFNVLDGLEIGDDTSATTQFWEDTNQTWKFAGFPRIADDFYRVEFRGHATGTHSVIFGTKTGTGVDATGAGGNTFVAGGSQPFHFVIEDTNLDTAGMYGCIFNNAGNTEGTMSVTRAIAEVIGCTYSRMGQISLDNSPDFLRNGVYNSVTTSTQAAIDLGTTKPTDDTFKFITIDGASHHALRIEGVSTTGDTWNFEEISCSASGTADVLVDYPAQTGGNKVTINLLENSAFSSTTQVAVTGGISLSDVVVAQSVTVEFTVIDQSNTAISGAQVSAYLVSDDSEVLLQDTNVSGIASGSFSGTTPADIYYKIRKSSPGDTKYIHDSGIGTIAAGSGFSVTRTLRVDPNNNA